MVTWLMTLTGVRELHWSGFVGIYLQDHEHGQHERTSCVSCSQTLDTYQRNSDDGERDAVRRWGRGEGDLG